jgi:predicted nucleotidyltransferase
LDAGSIPAASTILRFLNCKEAKYAAPKPLGEGGQLREVLVRMQKNNIKVPKNKIAKFCRLHHVRKLALFGSVLRDDFEPDSDVDVLVEFAPGHVPGFSFFAMQDELSELLGRRVELHTPKFLSRYFRDKVQAEAEIQYAER